MKKIFLTLSSILVLILSIGWYFSQPGYESVIGIIASLGGIISATTSSNESSGRSRDIDDLLKEGVSSNTRRFSPLTFIMTLLCFLLPFMTFSCVDVDGKIETTTATGIDEVVSGIGDMTASGLPEALANEYRSAYSLVALAFILAVIGAIVSFSANKIGTFFSSLLGLTGAILIWRSKSHYESAMNGESTFVSFEIGFWMILLFFILACLIHLRLFFDDG